MGGRKIKPNSTTRAIIRQVTSNLILRNMTRLELDIAVEWAAQEGWNPGLDDAEVFWQTDPKGFIALEKDGQMVGCGSIVAYESDFGFMGFFIVQPEFRSKGLGTKLWFYRRDTLLKRLGKGAAIGMDGVFAMQDFYTKGGFKFVHRDLRMETVAEKTTVNNSVSEINDNDFENIQTLDKECFGFNRETFLSGWLHMKHSSGFKFVDNQGFQGYAIVRQCRKGYKIGPLFARTSVTARELYKACANFAAGEPIYLDVPEINIEAMKLAQDNKMKECFGCAKMYHGGAPKLPYNHIYGVTTFELG